jgi:hypothetical protein
MEDIINSVTLIRIRIMRHSKKVAVHEFGRRSKAYATSSTLMDQSDLDTVVGLLNPSGDETGQDVATGTGNLAMAPAIPVIIINACSKKVTFSYFRKNYI